MQYPNIAISAKIDGMKPPEIRARLKQTGRTQIALARSIGKSKDSVSRLLKGERGLDVEEAQQIRAFFGDVDQNAGQNAEQVPVFGLPMPGGDDRFSLQADQIMDRIELPGGMTRGETIAVRLPGDDMAPRLFSGEIVIVAKGVPPARNGDCLVELKDGSGLIKQYVGQREGQVFLRQFNPDEEVRIPAIQVRALHSVAYRR